MGTPQDRDAWYANDCGAGFCVVPEADLGDEACPFAPLPTHVPASVISPSPLALVSRHSVAAYDVSSLTPTESHFICDRILREMARSKVLLAGWLMVAL